MDAYLLRNIDDALWHRVKVRAMTDRVTVRDVIEVALKLYASRGLDALGVVDEKKPKRKTA